MKRKPTTPRAIDSQLIEELSQSLAEGKRTSQAFPFDGRLHFERQLPFLYIYRNPIEKQDPQTEQLIIAEAAFLIASSNASQKKRNAKLVNRIVQTLSPEFGGFLLFEVWAGEEVEENERQDPEAVRPVFTIHADSRHDDEGMERVYESLRDGLKRVKIMGKAAEVALKYSRKTTPPKAPDLISSRNREPLNCFALGLEIQPIWRNIIEGKAFPLLLRALHRQVSKALRRACFTFTLKKTYHRPKHYFALGRQAVSRSMWDIDRKLAAIGSSFDFLLNVTPINSAQGWHAFKRNGFERRPVFHYRPLAIDPGELKRQLYSIDISKVEDPTLELIFREKRGELDRQLTMLADRNTSAFKYGSIQLYGKVEDSLVQQANEILNHFSGRRGDDTSLGKAPVDAIATEARKEIARFQAEMPNIKANVSVTPEVVGLMVSQGNLLLNDALRVPESRVRPLIAHEVGVHVLTYWNACDQQLKLLSNGLAGYDEFQEGFAVLSEYLVGGLTPSRLRLLAGRVVAARYLEDGASFTDTFRRLSRNHDFDQRTSYQIAMRVYRGGGLTKDHVYLRGLISILDYLKKGGEIEPLLVGKIARSHIPLIRELTHRQVLNPPKLRPNFLESESSLKRLETIAAIDSLLGLVSKPKRQSARLAATG